MTYTIEINCTACQLPGCAPSQEIQVLAESQLKFPVKGGTAARCLLPFCTLLYLALRHEQASNPLKTWGLELAMASL